MKILFDLNNGITLQLEWYGTYMYVSKEDSEFFSF